MRRRRMRFPNPRLVFTMTTLFRYSPNPDVRVQSHRFNSATMHQVPKCPTSEIKAGYSKVQTAVTAARRGPARGWTETETGRQRPAEGRGDTGRRRAGGPSGPPGAAPTWRADAGRIDECPMGSCSVGRRKSIRRQRRSLNSWSSSSSSFLRDLRRRSRKLERRNTDIGAGRF